MEFLGVLLGITMCAVAWAIKESIDNTKLIVELQNLVIFDLKSRITALEKRRPFVPIDEDQQNSNLPKSANSPSRVAAYRPRTWNEDTAQAEVK